MELAELIINYAKWDFSSFQLERRVCPPQSCSRGNAANRNQFHIWAARKIHLFLATPGSHTVAMRYHSKIDQSMDAQTLDELATANWWVRTVELVDKWRLIDLWWRPNVPTERTNRPRTAFDHRNNKFILIDAAYQSDSGFQLQKYYYFSLRESVLHSLRSMQFCRE